MERRRRQRYAILGVAVSAAGLQGCNTISGADGIAFVSCTLQLGTAEEDTSLAGGQGGGLFDERCPQGGVLTGLVGGAVQGGIAITQLSGACGTLTVSSHGPIAVTVTPGGTLPPEGTEAADLQQATCPAGQVVVGFEGETFMDTASMGTYVAQISLHCAPLVVSGVPNAPAISLGKIDFPTPIGATMGFTGITIPPTDCPAGQIAVASRGRSGSVLDAFGLGCAAPTMQCTSGM